MTYYLGRLARWLASRTSDGTSLEQFCVRENRIQLVRPLAVILNTVGLSLLPESIQDRDVLPALQRSSAWFFLTIRASGSCPCRA